MSKNDATPRLLEISTAIPKLKKSNQELAKMLCRYLRDSTINSYRYDADWNKRVLREQKLLQLLSEGKTQLFEVFAGTRKELIPFFFAGENAKMFEQLWDRLTLYTYEQGYGRRSFRSQKRTLLYLPKALHLFVLFFSAVETGCTMHTYFDFAVKALTAEQRSRNEQRSPEANAWFMLDSLPEHWMALAIDNGDTFVKQRIEEILTGENQQGLLNASIVRGVLMSRDAEMHQKLGNLLLAAKLQEGLRQTIFEAIDECSLEGFQYIMNLVLEYNLERFSSFVRSFGTWTALNFAEVRPAALKKFLELVEQMVSNPENVDFPTLLQSDNLIELYLVLWGLGLREIDDTKEPILTLMQAGSKSGEKNYKRLAALYFLRETENNNLAKDVVLGSLDETDFEIWHSLLHAVGEIFDEELSQRKSESSLKNDIEKEQVKDDDTEEDNEDDSEWLNDWLDEDEEKDEESENKLNAIQQISDTLKKVLDDEHEDLTLKKDPTQMRLKDSEIRTIFERLNALAESTPKKETKFDPDVYYQGNRNVSAEDFIRKMIDAAVLLGRDEKDIEMIYTLLPKMGSYWKQNFAEHLLSAAHPRQREILLDLYGEPHIGRNVFEQKFKKVEFTSEEYEKIEEPLRLKSADVRIETIKRLLARSPEGLLESITRLVQSKNEQKRLAGLDLIAQTEKLAKTKKEYKNILPQCKELTARLAAEGSKKGTKKTAAEEILVQKLTSAKSMPEYTIENGYGLCDPHGKIEVPEPKKSKTRLADLLLKNLSRYEKFLKDLDELIHKNKDYEYSGCVYYFSDEKKDFILGADDGFHYVTSHQEREKRHDDTRTRASTIIDDFPLADVWKDFAKKSKLTVQDFFLLNLIRTLSSHVNCTYFRADFVSFCEGKGDYKKYANFYVDWFNSVCWPHEKMQSFCQFFNTDNSGKFQKPLRYPWHIHNLVDAYWSSIVEEQKVDLSIDILSGLYHATPKNLFTQPCCTTIQRYRYGSRDIDSEFTLFQLGNPLLHELFQFCGGISDEFRFQERFNVLYSFYIATEFSDQLSPSTSMLEKARELNLVDDAELYRELLVRRGRYSHLSGVTNYTSRYQRKALGNKKETGYPGFERIVPAVIDRILEIELKRGDSETEVTTLATSIGQFQGIRYFVEILKAMDKTPFVRGYSYSNVNSRADVFCSLLQRCEPEENPDLNLFTGIPEQRLLEAAMYVPDWIEPVQKFLNWDGLTSACWYFHAHINESMDETKEAVIARYSPISPQRFKDGAFDIDWFNDAHQTLGEKRFQMVYDAAKYITSGGNHRRAQIFADAVRGKLKLEDVQKSASEKRNKDNLLAYSLIPLKKGKEGEKEQLQRYAFLQNFLKESKKFGAQRRESERKIVEIAMENLARAAGFPDVNRFTWAMETEKSKELATYFQPKEIDGFQLSVSVDEFGKAAIKSLKSDGTILKDVPTKLKKHEYVTELKEVVKNFRTQFQMVRENFERAMELETDFTVAELTNLSTNPVIRPIIEKLVFQHKNSFGFFSDGQLTHVNGKNETKKLAGADRVTIAHPFHLYENKVWKSFQEIVFKQEIIQPFKQVFRELYLPNADEKKSKTCSMRYAGHQVQPSKTVALLRGRNWTIDPDFGFQKVFYKLDVLIRLYCYADWFTPSEIESPTIEKIEFVDRKTLKVIPLEKIPPVIFSEIMRDLDLVVSVAHVGGVDPEASLSTVEMRAAILEETLRLLKLKNVTIRKSHVQVKGTLGEYSVHLGSGQVQMMAGGSLSILPVHSQQRGRLFLPFLDDDPKTAEILSKTVLLAEDEKIKDPTILNAIQNR